MISIEEDTMTTSVNVMMMPVQPGTAFITSYIGFWVEQITILIVRTRYMASFKILHE